VRVQLFATCLGDLTLPAAVEDAELLLREAGHEVVFPEAQICCGQPAFNAGHHAAAARVAWTFARAFSRDAPVVCPSGSCTAMVAHHLPDPIGVEPFEIQELSAFLAANGGVARRNEGRTVAYHDSCHMLRELGVQDEPRALLEASGATVVPLLRPDLCCGFGGTFSVKNPDVSEAMLADKIASVTASGAQRCTALDASCLMHIGGGLSRTGSRVRPVHLAEILAST